MQIIIIIIISVITRQYYNQSFPAQVVSDLLCALGNRIIMSFNSHQYGGNIQLLFAVCLSVICTLVSI